MTSPSCAQWRTPSSTATQHDPFATMWKRIRRSAPGWSASASVRGADSNANASVSSLRKKIAPSSRSCSSVDWSTFGMFGVAARRSGVLVMVTFAAWPDDELVNDSDPKGTSMENFPPLNHVALTVRDLSRSVPWYSALFDAEPVIDEDTDPNMHHTVYMVGGTLVGLHQHQQPAPVETF